MGNGAPVHVHRTIQNRYINFQVCAPKKSAQFPIHAADCTLACTQQQSTGHADSNMHCYSPKPPLQQEPRPSLHNYMDFNLHRFSPNANPRCLISAETPVSNTQRYRLQSPVANYNYSACSSNVVMQVSMKLRHLSQRYDSATRYLDMEP